MTTSLQQLSDAARQAMARQNWPVVDQIAQQMVQHVPNSAEGHYLTGKVFKAKQRPRQAVEAFNKALSLDSARYDAAIELADIYTITKENALSKKLLDEYKSLLANSPKYLDMAGTCYVNIGLPELALPLYQAATQLQPEINLFRANLAACSVFVGDITLAEEQYSILLQKDPNHQRNHYQLSRLKKAKDNTHINIMLDSLQANPQGDDRNIFMHFALGKEYEDLEQWDEAFTYYSKAGLAATQTAQYQLSEDTDLIDATITHCNKEWLQTTEPVKPVEGPTPIFIVGLPRTGTTLTERILEAHSQVKSIGETQFLPLAVRMASKVNDIRQMTPTMIEGAAKAHPSTISDFYLEKNAYRVEDSSYFIEKLPYNSLFIGFITKAFPNAKIILLERNPMDACFSMFKQVFTWAYKYSYTLENLGNYFCKYRQLIEHWNTNLPNQICTVSYESLVSNPKIETERLLDFAGLPFEESCLSPQESKTASTTASSVQVRSKIHTQSVKKWQNFENHLEPLKEIFDRAKISY